MVCLRLRTLCRLGGSEQGTEFQQNRSTITRVLHRNHFLELLGPDLYEFVEIGVLELHDAQGSVEAQGNKGG